MASRPSPRRGSEPEPGLFDSLPQTEQPVRRDSKAKGREPSPEKPTERASRAGKSSGAAPAKRASAAPAQAPPEAPPGPRILAVGELTRELAARVKALGQVAVEGEISGLKKAGSGHIYFGLKDQDAYLNCAIWRSRAASAARFPLEEGMRVVCHGNLDVYAPRGSYSLMVSKVERRGIGELLARLEELKAEWRAAGRFDRARPVPAMPRMIGIVTSRDTAAFQDFLRTRSMRWPLYPVRLVHTRVQGREAAREIAEAIARLDASGVDVIVVARGGGSLEDLWCFNELPVAEAIWRCSVPVVSGVGHETDITLADMVADRRAHTPTDAAQTVIPDRAALLERLERAGGYLMEAANRAVEAREERLQALANSRSLRDAGWILNDRLERIQRAGAALARAASVRMERAERTLERNAEGLARRSPAVQLAQLEARLAPLWPRLSAASLRALDAGQVRLDLVQRTLHAISPFEVLQRGYSITRKVGQARSLRGPSELQVGDCLETVLASGSILSEVQSSSESPKGDSLGGDSSGGKGAGSDSPGGDSESGGDALEIT